MGTRMTQILPLQINFCVVFSRQSLRLKQGGRSAHKILQQEMKFLLKARFHHVFQIMQTQFLYIGIQHFRDKSTPKITIITLFTHMKRYSCIDHLSIIFEIFLTFSISLTPGNDSNLLLKSSA